MRVALIGTRGFGRVHLENLERLREAAARLRDEEKFPDLDSLVAQMDLDAAQARAALAAADDHPQLQPHHRVTA